MRFLKKFINSILCPWEAYETAEEKFNKTVNGLETMFIKSLELKRYYDVESICTKTCNMFRGFEKYASPSYMQRYKLLLETMVFELDEHLKIYKGPWTDKLYKSKNKCESTLSDINKHIKEGG